MEETKWLFDSDNPSYSPFDDSPSNFYKCECCGYRTGWKSPYCPMCGSKKSDEAKID